MWHRHVAVGEGTNIFLPIIRIWSKAEHTIAVWHYTHAGRPDRVVRKDLTGVNVTEGIAGGESGGRICPRGGGEHGIAIGRVVHELVRYRIGHVRRGRPEWVWSLMTDVHGAKVEGFLVDGMGRGNGGLIGRPRR
jgi:hypothetical protein